MGFLSTFVMAFLNTAKRTGSTAAKPEPATAPYGNIKILRGANSSRNRVDDRRKT